MRLDWFTLIAQVVNFLVLVWLLKHFLYGRIVQAMNDREAKITGRLEAAAQMAQAEREADLFRTRNRELEEQRDQMLARAREEAESYRRQLMEDIRREIEAAQAQWFESLQRERQELLQDLRERLGRQVVAFARHALKALADADLEEQVLKVFVNRLQDLDSAEQEAIAAALRDGGEVELRTAFPVTAEMRESVSQSLGKQLDDRVKIRFTTVPELICGIELRAHSHRLVWSLDSYLEGVEARFLEVLDERAQKDAQPR